MPTLYLIDGYAQFFRAYHAIRTPLTSPVTKEPTNMTFGFVGMILKLLRGEGPAMAAWGGPPDAIAVALDISGDKETFRSELYPQYKAQRPPPPEDLRPQVERCLKILAEIGIQTVGVESFEADDTIATLITHFRRERPDLKIRIISKDKDLKQLLEEDHVELFDLHTDGLITESSFKEDTGLTPAQVIDMLALMGDTVDNVPGVPGIGPKTAAQLIAEHGSLDALLAAADSIKGKRGENIRATAPALPLSKQLVTLRHDAPVSLDLDAASTSRIHLDRLIPICKELGFNRYQDEVRALLGQPEVMPAPGDASDSSGASTATSFNSTNTSRSKRRSNDVAPADSLFGALAADSPAPSSNNAAATSDHYRMAATRADLDELLAELHTAPVIAIDTETTHIRPTRADLCGLSLSTKPATAWYVPVRSPTPDKHLDETTVLDALRPILEDPSKPKVGHNLKYDLVVLARAGIDLRGYGEDGGAQIAGTQPAGPDHKGGEGSAGGDTMIASYLIDSARSSHSMDALALALLRRTNIPISDLIGTGKNQKTFDTVPLDLATRYAAEDADVTLQLDALFQPQLRAMGLGGLYRDLEVPLIGALADMERAGILVDPAELDRQTHRLRAQIDHVLDRFHEACQTAVGRTIDPDSPKQLSGLLFNKPNAADPGLGIKPVKRTKTGYSTDAEVLDRLADDPAIESPIPRLVLEYRQLAKLVSTYLVALKDEINPDTGRIHCTFHQTVAATGRLAASDPNLQNIPIRTDIGREIRKAFIAPEGCSLVSADYSQIELRILAHLSRDPNLIAAFLEGQDIHTAVAAQIHAIKPEDVTREQRSGAKMVNFGIVYGITPFGLARRLSIETPAAAEIIDGYKRKFAGITTFLQECVEQARRHGYVETMLKRRRPITDIESNNPQRRALAERVAINSVVQGSAADLIKLAMVEIWREIRQNEATQRRSDEATKGKAERHKKQSAGTAAAHPAPAIPHGVRMLLQIHDELVFEAPDAVATDAMHAIKARMEAAMSLSVPLLVDAHVSKNWYEGK
ncbi:MAG: DNA polymerase I [Phycisphaerales bacterium]